MPVLLQVVDAFTDQPFRGNPAAVAVMAAFPSDPWMQQLAREMNLSETAFVAERPDGDHDLRWFTPSTEVDLCGHATLASAHVLGGGARFHTRSGLLTCRPAADGIDMDFPLDHLRPEQLPFDPGVGTTEAVRGVSDLLVRLPSAADVRGLVPDMGAVGALDCRSLIVTAPGDTDGIDFVSRVFAPRVGIAEDPVTGSAHCTLAAFWSPLLGRTRMVGFQASERGGTVGVTVEGDRVVLHGRAVTVSEVRLLHEPT
jgi:predicted PhzF superfamily epimerase YddE/YHI9